MNTFRQPIAHTSEHVPVTGNFFGWRFHFRFPLGRSTRNFSTLPTWCETCSFFFRFDWRSGSPFLFLKKTWRVNSSEFGWSLRNKTRHVHEEIATADSWNWICEVFNELCRYAFYWFSWGSPFKVPRWMKGWKQSFSFIRPSSSWNSIFC